MRKAGRWGERGITLLELMVAIFVSSILAAFIYKILMDQSNAFKRQEEMTRLQQNVRFAMEFVGRSVEMAGYGTNGWTIGANSTGIPAITMVDGGTGVPDQLQVLYADPSRLAITRWGQALSCSTALIPLENDGASNWYNEVDWMLCFSYVDSSQLESYLFQVDGFDTGDNEVSVTTPSGSALYDAACSGNLPVDMLCAPAQWFIFYVDNQVDAGGGPGTPAKPTLMLRESTVPLESTGVTPSSADSVLAEGIEHMNLEVCMQGNDCSSTASWDTTFDPAAEVDDVRQLRITFWAKSDKSAEGSTLYNDPLTGATDGKFRISQVSSVLVRNMRQLADYN